MPILLLIPILVLAVIALWAVLLPFSLWARYRNGRARRRAQGWVIRLNAWLLAASAPLLLLSAWLASRWFEHALVEAGGGLLLGALLGVISLWCTRFEFDPAGFHYTPNRWLVLGLTGLVAARIVAGLVIAIRRLDGGDATAIAWLDGGGLLAVAGLLLGYALAYTWGLRARLEPRALR